MVTGGQIEHRRLAAAIYGEQAYIDIYSSDDLNSRKRKIKK